MATDDGLSGGGGEHVGALESLIAVCWFVVESEICCFGVWLRCESGRREGQSLILMSMVTIALYYTIIGLRK